MLAESGSFWAVNHFPFPRRPRSALGPASALCLWLVAAAAFGAPRPHRLPLAPSSFEKSASHQGWPDRLLSTAHLPLPSKIEALSRRTDVAALRELIEIEKNAREASQPTLRLRLVQAFFEHSKTAHKTAAVRALARLFVPHSPDHSAGAAGRGPRSRVQATAAMALAASHDSEAQILLLSQSSQPTPKPGPGLSSWAAAALSTHPPTEEEAASLVKALGKGVVARALASSVSSSDISLPAKVDDLLDALRSPSLFLTRSRSFSDAYSKKRKLPSQFHAAAWQEAWQARPADTLRCLALLCARGAAAPCKHATRWAEQSVASKSERIRTAAAWSLAVLAPERAIRLLASDDAAIQNAVLRQAHVPELSGAAFQLSLNNHKTPLAVSALRAALRDPENWDRLSTKSLWELGSAFDSERTAALSARIRPATSPGLGPTSERVKSWLSHEKPWLRAAAAYGLGQADPQLSQGMLAQAYLTESHAPTRRAIVLSLWSQHLPRHPLLLRVAELDPDPGCRQIAQQGHVEPKAPFLMGRKAVGPRFLETPLGLRFFGAAAKDGFFAIAGVDPRASLARSGGSGQSAQRHGHKKSKAKRNDGGR